MSDDKELKKPNLLQRWGVWFKRNYKVCLVVLVIFAAYVIYAEKFRPDEDLLTLEDLKNALPVPVDGDTVIAQIDDLPDELVMHVVKDDELYARATPEQLNKSLNNIAKNAQRLCANPILGNILSSGRRVTVLLRNESHTFERKIAIAKCEFNNANKTE